MLLDGRREGGPTTMDSTECDNHQSASSLGSLPSLDSTTHAFSQREDSPSPVPVRMSPSMPKSMRNKPPHGRSKSIALSSVFGRPPVSSSRIAQHQRSVSSSLPLSASTRISSRGRASLKMEGGDTALHAIEVDRENVHPNVSENGNNIDNNIASDDLFSPVHLAKVKRVQKTPQVEGRVDSQEKKTVATASMLVYSGSPPASCGGKGSQKLGNSGRKKTRTDDGTTPTQTPLHRKQGGDGPMSPTPLSTDSSASFSSLCQTGEMSRCWIRTNLRECVAKWSSTARSQQSSPSSPLLMSPPSKPYRPQVQSLSEPTSTSGCFDLPCGSPVPLSPSAASPARSLATTAGSVGSSRKRYACDHACHDSPERDDASAMNNDVDGVDDEDLCSSMGGASSVFSGSLSGRRPYRCRARSRIFSPDSTEKVREAAAAAAVAVDDSCCIDFLRESSHTSCSLGSIFSAASAEGSRGTNKRLICRDTDSDGSNDDHSSASNSNRCLSYNDDDDESSVSSAPSLVVAVGCIKSDVEEDDTSLLPALTLQRSSRLSDDFADVVFSTVNGNKGYELPKRRGRRSDTQWKKEGKGDIMAWPKAKQKKEKKPQLTFDSISSYEDLKFLIKVLRKSVRGKTIASFGGSAAMGGCTIAIPGSWSTDRKASFMGWVTGPKVGFSLRSAGGTGGSFLQTTLNRAEEVLGEMERVLIEQKEKDVKEMIKMKTWRKKEAIAMAPPFKSEYAQPIPMRELGCFSVRKTELKGGSRAPATPLFVITDPNRYVVFCLCSSFSCFVYQ